MDKPSVRGSSEDLRRVIFQFSTVGLLTLDFATHVVVAFPYLAGVILVALGVALILK